MSLFLFKQVAPTTFFICLKSHTDIRCNSFFPSCMFAITYLSCLQPLTKPRCNQMFCEYRLFALSPVFANIHTHVGCKHTRCPQELQSQPTSGFCNHTLCFWKDHTQALQPPEKFCTTFFHAFLYCTHTFFHFAFFWCRRTLLEFGILAEFTRQQLIDSFSNDKLGESCLIDFLVHCMRHDDIVRKLDSFGYRVFVMTGFYVSLFFPLFQLNIF
jgi:hypothetical protein